MIAFAAIQDAVNNAADGSAVVLPSGYLDTAQFGPEGLTVEGRNHVRLLAHPDGTTLTNSLPGSNALTIKNSRFCRVRDVNFYCPTDGVGVKVLWDGISGYNTIGTLVQDCWFRGGMHGVKIGDGYGQSTSETTIKDCEFSNQTHSGVFLDTGNGQNTALLDNYTTDSPYGFYVQRGAIQAYRNKTIAHSVAAYHLSDVSQTPCTIADNYMESPCPFITSDGPTEQGSVLNLYNPMIYTTGTAEHIDAIVWKNSGPINITGGDLRAAPKQTTAIRVNAGAFCPVNVEGLTIWDQGMETFKTDNATGGFNVVNCLQKFKDGSSPVPLSRPLLASENGITQYHVVSTRDKARDPDFHLSLRFNSGLMDYRFRGEQQWNRRGSRNPVWYGGPDK